MTESTITTTYTCDRCLKQVPRHLDLSRISLLNESTYRDDYLGDLCSDCFDKLLLFFGEAFLNKFRSEAEYRKKLINIMGE